MKRTPLHTPSIWRVATLVVFTAIMGFADAWLVAWWVGSVWGTAVAAGGIVGLMVAIAWALRHYLPAVSTGLLVTAVAMTILLARGSPMAGLFSVCVALGIWGVWFLAYDVWFTGRANTEFVSPVTRLGRDGSTGRALISRSSNTRSGNPACGVPGDGPVQRGRTGVLSGRRCLRPVHSVRERARR